MFKKVFGRGLFGVSDDVRKILANARTEAIRLRHGYVGTEHLLLAAARDGAIAARLQRLGVAPEQVRAAVEERVPAGTESMALGELPYTSRAKKILEYAMAEARESGASEVRRGHLFLGIIREERGIASGVLSGLGITRERIRSLGTDAEKQDRKFRVQIDDSSDRSIYEQIVAQITEAAATGALRPGERLPTVRQLADELDVAPGTVARAYGELERQGLVITDGARGTRVAERTGAVAGKAERSETLVGLLRPVAVAAFHLGADAEDLRVALEAAMQGIFEKNQAA